MATYTLTVNGREHAVDVEPDTPLLWVLRDVIGLTGTKFGCGEGVCGACAVHDAEGRALRSCMTTILDAAGGRFTTVEGLGRDSLHAVQQAWLDEDVAQCGYCQPGMIMTAAALITEKPEPSDADIDEAMASSVCRCGTYNRMRVAIRRAAREMRRG